MEFLVSEEELKMKFLDPILLYGSELSGLINSPKLRDMPFPGM
jgi:hypothetical protein